MLGERDELVRAACSPCSGCCQRTSASTPTIAPVREVDLRLVVERRARRRRSRCRSSPTSVEAARRRTASCVGVVDLDAARARPWPRTWRRRRAAGASSTSSPCSGQSAMPMLRLDVERQALERRTAPRARRARARPTSIASPGAGDVGEQDAELVAAEPGDGVALAQRRGAGARPTSLQQQVAVVVAERVVDLLEPVEVDQEERCVGPSACARQDRLVGAVAEEAAVRERGERVVAARRAPSARRAPGARRRACAARVRRWRPAGRATA